MRAGTGPEVLGGVFGVDAALDGVAGELDVLLAEGEGLSGGDAELVLRPGRCPVTISVMGCSTWMRVFISMK